MIRIASIALTLAIASMISVVTPAIAANCKKGIPCGNSCISASKTCHKNGSSDLAPPRALPPSGGDVPAQIVCPSGTMLVPRSNPPVCRR